MRSKTISLKTYAVLAGLLLGAAGTAFADTLVTFQVDMSVQVGNLSFVPGTDTVSVHGSFNNWGSGTTLTNNPVAANTNLYTGIVDNTFDANGAVMNYKYVIDGGTYENTQDGDNRCAALPSVSGSSLTVDAAYFADAGAAVTNNVTFQVDMAQQVNLGAFNPSTMSVYGQGSFEGWNDNFPLTNDPSIIRTNQFGAKSTNVYTGTYPVVSPAGGTFEYKFVYNDGSDHYEEPAPGSGDPDNGQNRFFDGPTSNITLPVVFYNDQPYAPLVTNAVTFQVDMSAQILGGGFASPYTLCVNGNFNNWSTGVNPMTNDPAAANTNLYSAVVLITNGVGTAITEQFKFVDNGGNYESLAAATPQIGGNRYFTLADNQAATNVVTVLPVVFFSDQYPSDLLAQPTTVTFRVNMTNAVGTDSVVFNESVSVYVNGDFIGWPSWSPALPQMTETAAGSFLYTYSYPFPAGNSLVVNYKYSMNGVDDEAGFGLNHTRYIRATNNYVMPIDIFGDQLVEQSFGNLAIGKPSGGSVPVTWLGRPGVHLQVSTNLSVPNVNGAIWVDHPETDGTSATNWPVGGTPLYFRLVHPPK